MFILNVIMSVLSYRNHAPTAGKPQENWMPKQISLFFICIPCFFLCVPAVLYEFLLFRRSY